MDATIASGLKAIDSQTPSNAAKSTSIGLEGPLDHAVNKMAAK